MRRDEIGLVTGDLMQMDELRATYNRLYRFIQDEAAWRDKVFPVGHPLREPRLAAANQALQDLIALKDVAKVEVEAAAAEMVQLRLVDAPERYRS